jgi:hypothetical protein
MHSDIYLVLGSRVKKISEFECMCPTINCVTFWGYLMMIIEFRA